MDRQQRINKIADSIINEALLRRKNEDLVSVVYSVHNEVGLVIANLLSMLREMERALIAREKGSE